jgi:hypothetical protein
MLITTPNRSTAVTVEESIIVDALNVHRMPE